MRENINLHMREKVWTMPTVIKEIRFRWQIVYDNIYDILNG